MQNGYVPKAVGVTSRVMFVNAFGLVVLMMGGGDSGGNSGGSGGNSGGYWLYSWSINSAARVLYAHRTIQSATARRAVSFLTEDESMREFNGDLRVSLTSRMNSFVVAALITLSF